MGGSNPYIEPIETQAATQPFSVTFKTPEENLVVQVDPSKIPYGPTGQPGSILDIAMGAGLDVEHACGGASYPLRIACQGASNPGKESHY